MKKLWLLTPIDCGRNTAWDTYANRCFGFVIRAGSETEARSIATENGRAERYNPQGSPWETPLLTTCTELTGDGEIGIVLQEDHGA